MLKGLYLIYCAQSYGVGSVAVIIKACAVFYYIHYTNKVYM